MAIITLKIKVPSVEQVLLNYDKIKVYRSTNGSGGPFSEITGPATRITIVSGQSVYTYTDSTGDATYYYQISYFNSATLVESNKTAPVLGEESKLAKVMTVEDLKTNYLFGIDLTDDFNNPYPDSLFEHYIQSAVQHVENFLDIKIACTVIEDERHSFYLKDYYKFIITQLYYKPVISVESVKIVLPTNQEVITFAPSAIFLDREGGNIEVIPGTNQLVIGQSGSLIHTMLSGGQDYVPDIIRVNYTAGFNTGQVPHDLLDVIGMLASMGPLNIAGDLVLGAGVARQSITLDGLTQEIQSTSSPTNAGYGARIYTYFKQIQLLMPGLKAKYRGIQLEVV